MYLGTITPPQTYGCARAKGHPTKRPTYPTMPSFPGIFRRLVEDRFTERFPSVLICGRGFPDLATRAMVHQITERFQVRRAGIV